MLWNGTYICWMYGCLGWWPFTVTVEHFIAEIKKGGRGMQDRIPGKPNRKKITYEDGTIQYATVEYADEPIAEGTPINKATLLQDDTAAALALGDNPTVDDALKKISTGYCSRIDYTIRGQGAKQIISSTEKRAVVAAPYGTDGVFFTARNPTKTYWMKSDQTLTELAEPETTGIVAGRCGDGSVLIIGSKTAERYDASGIHTVLPTEIAPRREMASAVTADGKVMIAGGLFIEDWESYLRDEESPLVQVIDSNGVVTSLESLSKARTDLAGTTLGDGSCVFFSGYQPFSGNQQANATDRYYPDGRHTSSAGLDGFCYGTATLGDGSALIAGGYSRSARAEIKLVRKYDVSGIITQLPALNTGYCDIMVTPYGDGNVLLAGGAEYDTVSPEPARAEAYLYDSAGVRTSITGLPEAMATGACATNDLGEAFLLNPKIINNTTVYDSEKIIIYQFGNLTISVIPGMEYKFLEHTTAQRALTDEITIKTPNEGYLLFGGKATL